MIDSGFRNGFVIFGVIGLGIVGSLFFNPILVWGAVAGLMVVFPLLASPGPFLFSGCSLMAMQPLLARMIGVVDYLDQLFVAGCVASLVGAWALLGKLKFQHRGYLLCCVGLWGAVLVSILLNHVPPLIAINSVLTYFLFPIIFIYAYQYRSRRACTLFIQTALIFLAVQLVLNAGWILGINPLPNEMATFRKMADISKGTVGRCDFLAYILLALLFLFYSVFKDKSFKLKGRRLYAAAIPLVFLQFYLTFTNHAIAYLPIAGMAYLYLSERNMAKIARFAVLFILLASGALFVERALSSTSIFAAQSYDITQMGKEQVFSRRNLQHRYEIFMRGPKMQLYRRVFVDSLRAHPDRWMIGYGAGNGTSAIGMARASDGAVTLLAEFYLTASGRGEMRSRSVTQEASAGYISLWSEIGAVGFLFFQLLYIIPLVRVGKHLWRRNYTNSSQRILAEAYIPAVLIFMQASFMADLYWVAAFYVGLMTWTGFVFDPLPEPSVTQDEAPA